MEPIAILGRGCVLPGALTPEALWEAVAAGADLTSGPPDGRWGLDTGAVLARPGEPLADRTLGARGGYVRGFETVWDAHGFAVPPTELADLDPVCLWLLHATRQAWREAGADRFDRARVGAVVANLSYPTRGLADFAGSVWRGETGIRPENRFVSGYPAHLLARALGLGGRAFALDAACASSLYALKHACDALSDGAADAMVVGAVNAADNLFLHMGFTALGALSKSGASRPFSKRADGLLPAEGAAAVVLMRARDVDPARDRVLGVIRGVGVSNDGRRRGLLAPDADGQREALARAYQVADIDPAAVSLVECHATGTPTGDPIEIEGLKAVFAKCQDLPVGSLKSNVGHLLTVAGLAGLLKLVGALEHETRPPTRDAADAIDAFAAGPVRPLRAAEPWPAGDSPRRAGLSAFGFGGANAHLVLEEWRPDPKPRRRAARARDAIVICGVGASAGDAIGVREILQRLEAPPPARPAVRREEIVVNLARVKLPPADLEKTLVQQTLLFEATDEALAGVAEPAAERVGVFVGMGCDPEAARWAQRWRAAATAAERDAIVAPLDAAHVLGAMPNVPANRLNALHDWRGQGFTVSGEELSGLEALAVGVGALARGELDLAIVAAVDLADEPVHTEAVRRLIGEHVVPGDAAVVLALKRRADAERDGDPILATLSLDATGDAESDDETPAALAARFGTAHAASGLLALGVAAAAGARRRQIARDGARAWLATRPTLTVSARSFTGRTASARLAFDAAPLPMRLGDAAPKRAKRRRAGAAVEGEVALVFTGAAAAYPGMGRGLLAAFPDAGARVAARFGEADDVTRMLARDPKALAAPFEQLRATTLLSQVHAEIALGLLGLRPRAALGVSSGETNALLALGAWRDPDALLADVRASAMYERWLSGRCETAGEAWDVKPGTPIAWRCWRLLAPIEEIRAAIADIPRLALSIVHGPSDCVIAGEAEACRIALARLGAARAVPLGQDMVVHCAEAAPFADRWRAIHTRETWAVADVRFYTNATNAAYAPTRETAADMLTAQAVAPIDFAKTVEQAWADGVRVFVELGPRDALTRAIGAVLGERPHLAVAFDRVDRGDVAQIAEAAAALQAAGVALDLAALDARLSALAADSARPPPPQKPLHLPAHPPPVPRRAATNVLVLKKPPRLASAREPAYTEDRLVAAGGELPHAPALARATTHTVGRSPPPPGGEGVGGVGGRAIWRANAKLPRPTPAHPESERPRRAPPTPAPPPQGGREGYSPPSRVSATPEPPRPPSGPAFSRAQLEAAARWKISDLFGTAFSKQDGYARQVRMPAPPLLLADRVLGIDAEPGAMGKGTIWTETDVADGAWHLHAGRMRPGIVIESGQADLLLASYMGADFLNAGERVYRLLGCELTFHDHPPKEGDTLRFAIDIERHASLGEVRLFFFHYDAHVAGRPLLSVRSGQAGFFTDAELAASQGVLWDAAPPTAEPRLAPLPRASAKRAFSKRELDAFLKGDARACFGPGFARASAHQRTPRPPSGRLRMIDAVEAFEPEGGPWGRGYLRAAASAPADAWFYDGHFHNDPCMPGTLMAEAAVQALELFMVAAGLALDRDGWRFEPATGEAFKFICRGQVIPDRDHALTYEVFVDEIVDGPEPTVYAALLARSDGFKVFACPRFGVRLVRDWPISDRAETSRLATAPKVVSPTGGVRGDEGALLACAWGKPSDAFGEMYARFDRESSVPRLPGPPYHAVSRIVSVTHPPGAPAEGIAVVAEYDPPADAWFFDANGHAVMPFATLTEALLQPCGWLASYCGFALEGSLAFRNLDGEKAVVAREIRPGDGPLRVEATLTRWSKAGPLTIVFFDVAARCGGGEVMTLTTSFGFFPKAALAAQAGLPTTDDMRARLTETAPQEDMRGSSAVASPPPLEGEGAGGRGEGEATGERANEATPPPVNTLLPSREHPAPYPPPPRGEGERGAARPVLPRAPLAMIDAISGFWPEGGEAGLGRIRGRQAVDSNAWYFKAHFYEDPVQPGSLGLDALLQLLARAMLLKGLDDGFTAPRFETPALGVAMRWKYRGQVTPEAKGVVTTLDLTAIAREPSGVLATAKASLWVDGLRIYEVDGLSARLVEGEPARARRTTLSLADQPWLADHRPTYTLPALPMAGALAHAAEQLLETAAFPLVVEDFTLKRWIVVADAPAALEARAAPRGSDRFDLALAVDGALAAEGRARIGGPVVEPEPWPALAPVAPINDLYDSGALFHGPRFHLLTDVRRNRDSALATLDPARAFDPNAALDVGLLDALLHAIPHDSPELWFGSDAAGFAAYPRTIERLVVHRLRPRDTLTVRARPLGPAASRSVRVAIRAEGGDGPWLDLVLEEILMPKGPLGRLPPADRRAFLAEGRHVPGAGLARTEGEATVLALADIGASDWLPGTLRSVYRLTGATDAAREIAIKEHAARAWAVHPRDVMVDRDAARCGRRRLRVAANLDGATKTWRVTTAESRAKPAAPNPESPPPPTDPAPDIDVASVDDRAVLHLVQHQRYEILVGEQQLAPPGADHARRLVVDDLDLAGRSFAAFAGPALVGSVRVNVVADGGADAFASAYGLSDLGADWQARTAIVTRLVSRGPRGGPLLSKLVAAVLGVVAERKARWIAIGVEAPLIDFYESMGFARHRDAVTSPSGGLRTVLVLDVEDPRHRDKATLAGWLYPALFAPD